MSSELDPQARALIGLALRGEQRLPRQRERVRRGVLAALATPAALGATDAALAAGKAASLGSSSIATGPKALLVGVLPWLKAAPLVALGVTASVVGLKQLQSTPPPRSIVSPAALTPTAAAAPKSAPLTSAAAVAAAPSVALRPSRAAPSSPLESPASTPPSLAVELEALQRAQRALNAGNPSGALVELRVIKGPTLRAERTALEVFAQCALGNVALARRQAALFRQLAPHSPLLPRVDASCGAD